MLPADVFIAIKDVCRRSRLDTECKRDSSACVDKDWMLRLMAEYPLAVGVLILVNTEVNDLHIWIALISCSQSFDVCGVCVARWATQLIDLDDEDGIFIVSRIKRRWISGSSVVPS